MSENLLIVFITVTTTLLGALLTAFAALVAAKKGDGTWSLGGCSLIGFTASAGGIVGLVLGLLLAVFVLQQIGYQKPAPAATDQPLRVQERIPTQPIVVVTATPLPPLSTSPSLQPTTRPPTDVRPASASPTGIRPAATQLPQLPPTLDTSMQQAIDRLFGAGNWRCMDGFPSGISIDKIPANFVVGPPFISVDTGNGTFGFGETASSKGYATGWLERALPNNKCSLTQTQMTRSVVDQMVGSGNWFCFDAVTSGVMIRNVPPNFVVRSPTNFVDKDEVRYYQGMSVPNSGLATLWFSGNLPVGECAR